MIIFLSRILQLMSFTALAVLLAWLSSVVPEGSARAVVNLAFFVLALAAPLLVVAVFMGWLDIMNPLIKTSAADGAPGRRDLAERKARQGR